MTSAEGYRRLIASLTPILWREDCDQEVTTHVKVPRGQRMLKGPHLDPPPVKPLAFTSTTSNTNERSMCPV